VGTNVRVGSSLILFEVGERIYTYRRASVGTKNVIAEGKLGEIIG